MQLAEHFEKELATLIQRRLKTLLPGQLRSILMRAANKFDAPTTVKGKAAPRKRQRAIKPEAQ